MTRDLFKQYALSFLNLPYIWGGDDPIIGFDCSGLTQELLSAIGLDPAGDQTAQGLYDWFKSRSKEGPRDLGTLIFYGSAINHITHVAMFLDDQTIIEAGGGGSKTVDAIAAAKQNAYIRLRPFTKRTDMVAVVTPKGLPW